MRKIVGRDPQQPPPLQPFNAQPTHGNEPHTHSPLAAAIPTAGNRRPKFDPSLRGGIALPGHCQPDPTPSPISPTRLQPAPRPIVGKDGKKTQKVEADMVHASVTEPKDCSAANQRKSIQEAADALRVVESGFGGNSAEMHAFFLCKRSPSSYYRFDDPDLRAPMLCFSDAKKRVRFAKFPGGEHIALAENMKVKLEDFATALGLQPAGPAARSGAEAEQFFG